MDTTEHKQAYDWENLLYIDVESHIGICRAVSVNSIFSISF